MLLATPIRVQPAVSESATKAGSGRRVWAAAEAALNGIEVDVGYAGLGFFFIAQEVLPKTRQGGASACPPVP